MNKVNLRRKNKKKDNSITHFKVRYFIYLGKAIRELKSGCGIAIKPNGGMGGNEFAIEAHCDAGGIMGKKGSMAQIRILAFSKEGN